MKTLAYLWLESIKSEAGGAITHMLEFLHSLEELKYGYFVLSSNKYSYLENIPCKPIGFASRAHLMLNINFNPLLIRKMRSIVCSEKPSLIYQRHVGFTDIGARLAKDLKIPFFLEFNGSVEWVTKQWVKSPIKKITSFFLMPLIKYYEKKAINGATKIFVISNASKKQLLGMGVPKEKIIVNPNGVDTDKFNPKISGANVRKKYGVPKTAVIVGFIGTFGRWHGAEVLAEAAKNAVRKRNDVYFIFMGDGYYRKDAENASGTHKRIIFTGAVPRDAVPTHLAACDILVNPTVLNPDGTEFFGSPTKLFEYMAMGKAIVSSNIGQMKEILEENKDALLIEAGNPDSLKNSILILAKNKKLRKKLGTNARKKVVKKYTWKMNAKRVLDEYEKLQRLRE